MCLKTKRKLELSDKTKHPNFIQDAGLEDKDLLCRRHPTARRFLSEDQVLSKIWMFCGAANGN